MDADRTPARPANAADGGAGWTGADDVHVDVGEFAPGTPFSRWALARYIVGRVVLERVSWALLGLALLLVLLAVGAQWGLHVTVLAVLLVIVALGVLVLRAALRAILHRLMNITAYGPLEKRVGDIVDGASSGVSAELRRVGLPSHVVTMPLLLVRLLGRRRRAETMARVRRFEVDRAVPKASRDELVLVLRQSVGRS